MNLDSFCKFANINPLLLIDNFCMPLGVSIDSRKIKQTDLFIAIPGVERDGTEYIDEALQKGATSIIVAENTSADILKNLAINYPRVQFFTSSNIRLTTSLIAAHFFPKQPNVIVAVTGTNGKSSTVSFIRQIWTELGLKSASLGTLGLVKGDGVDTAFEAAGLTTPDAISMHSQLNDLSNEGYTHLALEASSHGLDQYRLDGLKLSAGVFTNLSNDHLDYHKDMADYLQAKERLFSELLPQAATAIINADINEADHLLQNAQKHYLNPCTFGVAGNFIKLLKLDPQPTGQHITIAIKEKIYSGFIPLIGKFQIENILAALTAVISCGGNADEAFNSILHLEGVPGRLEQVSPQIYVDYAHTPHALESALTSLRPHVQGKLIVVFGCGGNRDALKRPQMGSIANAQADIVVVTDDNPRNEDPKAIRQEILKSCPKAIDVGGRRDAIRFAMDLMKTGDVLLIAGKGHENYQVVDNQVNIFSDQIEVKNYIRDRK